MKRPGCRQGKNAQLPQLNLNRFLKSQLLPQLDLDLDLILQKLLLLLFLNLTIMGAANAKKRVMDAHDARPLPMTTVMVTFG